MPTKKSVRDKSTQDNANVITYKYNRLNKHKLEGHYTIPSKRSKFSNTGLLSLPTSSIKSPKVKSALTTDLKVIFGKIAAIMT